MVFPTSYASAVVLLLLSFVCFSIWPNLYKRSERRWRFELFSLDFSIGAILVALLGAYTLGTLGPEMSFTDRMLIAGRAASVWVIGAGVIFALGNMLLLASITLLGMARAFAVTFGTATALASAIYMPHSHPLLACVVITCFVLCVGFALRAPDRARSRGSTLPGIRNRARFGTAAALAVVSGLTFGGMQLVMRLTDDPDFGPGPYASILMLGIGILIATPALNFFFMNIRLAGSPISLKLYVQGGFQRHVPGLVSGAIWAIGALSLLLAPLAAAAEAPSAPLVFLIPVSSVVACILLGLFRWKELPVSQARTSVVLSALFFAAGIVVAAVALAK